MPRKYRVLHVARRPVWCVSTGGLQRGRRGVYEFNVVRFVPARGVPAAHEEEVHEKRPGSAIPAVSTA
eukprot:1009768-Rhodomonas_salina.5